MKSSTLHTHVVFALALSLSLAPLPSSAESRHDEYAGATCIPYPPFNVDNAIPYSYYMYGIDEMAFCHFAQLGGWSVDDLSHVFFYGDPGATQPIRVRLCIYSTYSTACGAERTIASGGVGLNWVAPPWSPPSYALGAYLSVSFPPDQMSIFRHFTPVWTR